MPAPHGNPTGAAGAVATAACQAAHAVLAGRGQWVTNEKRSLDRAGLRGVDDLLTGLSPEPGRLVQTVDRVSGRLQERVV